MFVIAVHVVVFIGELSTESHCTLSVVNVGYAALSDAVALFTLDTLIHPQECLHEVTVLVNIVRFHALAGIYREACIFQRFGDNTAYLRISPVYGEAYIDAAAKSAVSVFKIVSAQVILPDTLSSKPSPHAVPSDPPCGNSFFSPHSRAFSLL